MSRLFLCVLTLSAASGCANVLGLDEYGDDPSSALTAAGAGGAPVGQGGGFQGGTGGATAGDGGSSQSTTAAAGGAAEGGAATGGGSGGAGGSACVPKITCAELGARCDLFVDDGCGNSIKCSCPAGTTCGGSGKGLCGDFICSISTASCPTNACVSGTPSCCHCNSNNGACAVIDTNVCTYQGNNATTAFYCCP